MENDSREGVLERNLGRLVRRWADPLSPGRIDGACQEFLRRLSEPASPVSPKPAFGGRVGFAAALLLGAITFWAIFSWRGDRAARPGSGLPERHSQVDPGTELQALLDKLSSPSFDEQGRAAEAIRKLGKNAVGPLHEARNRSKDPGLTQWIDRLVAAIEKDTAAERPPSAVHEALTWLARHQNPDGSWGANSFEARCLGVRCGGIGDRDYDTGVTALSLLAFLGAGYSQLSKDEYDDPAHPGHVLRFGRVVQEGIQWLLSRQDSEGRLCGAGAKEMYIHAIGALCLSEAYGMTASASLRAPAQKAIDVLVAAQNPGKAWRYSSRCGDNDTSVTGWAVFALASAQISELQFPPSCFTGALRWLDEVTARDGSFEVGYNAPGSGKVYTPGKNEQFAQHPTMSAIAVLSRIFMKQKRSLPAMGSVALLAADLPAWEPNRVDFYYWHFGSLALFQYDGPGGPLWKSWSVPLAGALVTHQKTPKDGCQEGSWDPGQERWGRDGGRVYTTAMGALTLEVCYHYARVWEPKK